MVGFMEQLLYAHCLMINYSHSIAFDILNDTGGATAQLTNLCSKNVFHSLLVERILKYPCTEKHILTFLGPEHRWCKALLELHTELVKLSKCIRL